MTNLSPAAQAVLAAYEESSDAYFEERGQLAAALRAVAEMCVYPDDHGVDWILPSEILAIADELDASND
jgi:hypothetical protein